jgi:hypothetical protein
MARVGFNFHNCVPAIELTFSIRGEMGVFTLMSLLFSKLKNFKMLKDYVPQNDADFNSWQANLVEITEANLIPWGILAADFTTLQTAQTLWNSAYADAEIKTDRSTAEVKAKIEARGAYETALRTFYNQWLAGNTRVSTKDRERMELTIKVDSRKPAPVPTTIPIGNVDFSNRLHHEISFVDSATPTRRAKPEGVHGCEIWTKVDGAAPVKASEVTYLGTATRSPYKVTFDGDQQGKIAYYMLRWVNMREEPGLWSSVISATVAG